MDKEIFLKNIKSVHTTILGLERIKKNLNIEKDNVMNYCLSIIKNPNSIITRKGKNYYFELDNEIITINAYSYTIITAHKKKTEK